MGKEADVNSDAARILGPAKGRTQRELRINIDANVASKKCETRT
jgi:hypothetical protein